MDIVYKSPFILKINETLITNFTMNEPDIYTQSFSSARIYENDEVNIYFNSTDINAKLYLDALDIIPDGQGVIYDDDGRPYRGISENSMPLFLNNGEYDALRVDSFRMVITSDNQKYFGLLEVMPKQLSTDEWIIMRDDLEEEISGLAQDIVRRNIGLGTNNAELLPPEKLYEFMVIQKYAKSVMGALNDLKDKAKYHIIKEYQEEPDDKAINIDSETVKRYLRPGSSSSNMFVPHKNITYDIQENRLLKRILQTYEYVLNDFIRLTVKIKTFYLKNNKDNHQYQLLFIQGIDNFHETAVKLRKITGIIKTQSWYQNVGQDASGIVPHSFALDVRYGTLYKMYQELLHPKWNVKLDPNYAYSWRKSSSLYEMWCYIKICRAMNSHYAMSSPLFNIRFDEHLLFPFLENGTTMKFEDERVRINVIFDQFIPKKKQDCQLDRNPFYTVSKKNRPDITMDVYSKITKKYVGSLILECKYRKLSSYWFDPFKGGKRNAGSSSKPQILSYYNDMRSKYYRYGVLNGHPIYKVIVLTPDVYGLNSGNNNECGDGVINRALKPSTDEIYLNEIMRELLDDIDFLIEDELEYTRTIRGEIGK